MLIQKIKIAYIHFIRKSFFILKVKLGLYKKNPDLIPYYFLDSNDFLNEQIKIELLNIESEQKILEEAELIIQNKFQTLGSQLTYLGEKINWQQDFKSGRTWDKIFYTKINSKESINGSDIKVPWELSRFHQSHWLAKAFIINSDEKYANKFFDLILNWIEQNPFCYGVNWNCAMEVAIRAVNWIFALHIFKFSQSFNEQIAKKIYNSLYQHGLFIRNNLEYGRRNGNHYLSDLMGLIWIGAFFYKYRFGRNWFRFAKKELEKEILIQVYEDGVDYEKSTFYQRLVTEILTLSYIVAERLNKPFSIKFKERLHKMFEFIASYVLGDEVPNVGDCDDGRIIKFNFFEKVSEMRNTLVIGAVIFNDQNLKSKAEKNFVDVLLLLGLDGYKKFSEIQTVEILTEHKIFPDGGYAVLNHNGFFIFFDFGDIGMNGWGGHGHNDILSFELAYKGKRFFVDSGTYLYTPDPEMRQKFRSTYSHNTVLVDNTEQAEFLNLFRIKEDLSKPQLTSYNFNSWDVNSVYAEHSAYLRLKNPIKVIRIIELNLLKNSIKVLDAFENNGENQIEVFYHLHPEVKIRKFTDTIYELSRDNVRIKIEFWTPPNSEIKIEEYVYSESYGKIQNNLRFRIRFKITKRFKKKFGIEIFPLED